jgi:4-hydroxy-tetrahydrodipicolinate reductase
MLAARNVLLESGALTIMRLAIIGDGKMGRSIASLALERGHEVVAIIGLERNREGRAITREGLGNADVALEFTEPDAALANVIACVRAATPVVVGTTGWYANLPLVIAEVERRGGALIWAPNFSIGVAVLTAAAELVSRSLRDVPGFDAHLVETHHAAKKDRPSGTAAALSEAASRASGREIPITSVRVGHVPGTHELVFDAPFEQLRLTHEARDRRVFADGAIRAAEWLPGRRGVFTMRDVLRAAGEPRP